MFSVDKLKFTDKNNFFLIAGPCAIEGEEMAMEIAEKLFLLSNKYQLPFIFKGSFRKANRTRIDSFAGIGDLKALEILKKVSERFDIPVITDIHIPSDAALAAKYVDVIQIPAFLVRQTDLVVAAAKTNLPLNLKKAQFMTAKSMQFAVDKARDIGNDRVMVTERGNMFGYGELIVDFRNIPELKKMAPTVLDVTHSLQKPNQESGVTGGQPKLIELMARLGITSQVDGLFLETHMNPSVAKSDGANMIQLDLVDALLGRLVKLNQVIRSL
jgi:2-dehydro-3-deoxyphosphooctonate aldolase (KDO 8-P synthase)